MRQHTHTHTHTHIHCLSVLFTEPNSKKRSRVHLIGIGDNVYLDNHTESTSAETTLQYSINNPVPHAINPQATLVKKPASYENVPKQSTIRCGHMQIQEIPVYAVAAKKRKNDDYDDVCSTDVIIQPNPSYKEVILQ